MKSFKSRVLLLFVCVAIGMSLSTAVYAASGTVVVKVVDKEGPVIGATVSLSDANKQYPTQSLVTDENGHVTFGVVQPGSTYIVSVTMPGYQTYNRGGIKVVTGIKTEVTAGLLPEIKEEVIVRGRTKVVELDSEGQGQTAISGEAFQDLPIFGRDYQAALTLAPGVTDTKGDGNPNVFGARDRDFKTTVNGVSNVDPLTGQYMSNINPDSIEEISITTTGADASFGGAVGGFNKILTKSGGNKLTISAQMFMQEGMFNKRLRSGRSPSYRRREPALFVTGPIIRDRLWFAVGDDIIKRDNPIQTITGTNFVQTYDRQTQTAKLTWQVTPKNKLQAEFRSDPLEIKPAGVDAVTPPSSGVIVKSGGPTYQLTWNAPFSPSFFWETIVAFSDINVQYRPYDRTAKNDCYQSDDQRPQWDYLSGYYCIDAAALNRRSGAFFQDYGDKRQRWTYALSAEQFIDRWMGGQHRVKFGMELGRTKYAADAIYAPYMVRGSAPSSASWNPGEQVQPARAAFIDLVSWYFPGQTTIRQDNFQRPQNGDVTSLGNNYGAYISDTYEPRENLTITVGARMSREELSSDGYKQFDPRIEYANFQNAWPQIRQILTDNGVCPGPNCVSELNRWAAKARALYTFYPLDNPALLEVPDTCVYAINGNVCRAIVDGAQLDTNPFKPLDGVRYRQGERFMITHNNIAPRVSVQWDPKNDNKSKIQASWGRYYNDTPLVPLVDESGPDNTVQRFNLDGSGHIIDPNNGIVPRSTIDSAFSVTFIDRNLKAAYSDELAIKYEREIANETSLALSFVDRKFRDQLQARDINHRPLTDQDVLTKSPSVGPIQPLENGDPCPKVNGFWDCTGILTRIDNSSQYPQYRNFPDGIPDLTVVNPNFNAIYEISNYNSTDARAYVVELNRRFYQNWELSASYVWSKIIGDAEDYSGTGLGADATVADMERGYLSYDIRHQFKLYGRVVVNKFGGLIVGGVVTWQSGTPYSIFESRSIDDFPLDLTSGTAAQYNIEPANASYRSLRTVYVTGKRNDQRNPGFWDVGLNLQKEFMIKDVKATFMAKVINVLNDQTLIIDGVQRIVTRNLPGKPQLYVDQPIGTYRVGRRFELGFKLNWG